MTHINKTPDQGTQSGSKLDLIAIVRSLWSRATGQGLQPKSGTRILFIKRCGSGIL